MENRVERIYTNQVLVNVSAYDIVLMFCNKRNGELITPEDAIAEVVMSPQHAKALMLALKQNIVDYERIFGTINIEPNKDAFAEVQAKSMAQAREQAQAISQAQEQAMAMTMAQTKEQVNP